MMWPTDNRAQTGIEVMLVVVVAIVVATSAAAILKGFFTQTQVSVLNQTNAALNKTA